MYDESFFDCPICGELFQHVIETPCCHKCYCHECLKAWLDKSLNCPECRAIISSLDSCKPNFPIQRLVDSLPLDCPNKILGCTDRITRGIEAAHKEKCLFVMVPCSNAEECGVYLRKDLQSHLDNNCLYRPTVCQQCGHNVPQFRQLEEHLRSQCENAEVECAQCSAKILRKDVPQHNAKECPEYLAPCPFAAHGCNEMVIRKDIDNHMNESMQNHLAYALKAIQQKDEEISHLTKELQAYREGVVKMKPNSPFATFLELPVITPTTLVSPHPTNLVSTEVDGREASYRGALLFVKGSTARMVRSNVPIPNVNRIFYFEMKIMSSGRDGAIGIGFVKVGHNLEGMPGWTAGSYGYHGDDGRLFSIEIGGKGEDFGPKYGKDDVIGAGWDQQNGTFFFTKNGQLLGSPFTKINPKDDFYAAIGLHSPGARVRVNFGQDQFVYQLPN